MSAFNRAEKFKLRNFPDGIRYSYARNLKGCQRSFPDRRRVCSSLRKGAPGQAER
jgi:hypothetical protein